MKRFPVLLTFLALALAVRAFPQYTTASLAGSVNDASSAAIPGAKVTVRNTETGYTQTINADSVGAFLFSRLPVGSYELKVEQPGFSVYMQSGLTLTVNQVANQPVTLQVGQVSDRVNVEANAEVVSTRTATSGQDRKSTRLNSSHG